MRAVGFLRAGLDRNLTTSWIPACAGTTTSTKAQLKAPSSRVGGDLEKGAPLPAKTTIHILRQHGFAVKIPLAEIAAVVVQKFILLLGFNPFCHHF